MKRTVEYLGKSEDGFAEYEISESIENDSTSKVYKPEKIEYPRPKKVMELNKEEFLKTEFGTGIIYLVDLLDEYHIARSRCAEREDWGNFYSYRCQINELDVALQVVKVAIKQFYGIEYEFCQTDDYYGLCTEDGSDWLFKIERED